MLELDSFCLIAKLEVYVQFNKFQYKFHAPSGLLNNLEHTKKAHRMRIKILLGISHFMLDLNVCHFP